MSGRGGGRGAYYKAKYGGGNSRRMREARDGEGDAHPVDRQGNSSGYSYAHTNAQSPGGFTQQRNDVGHAPYRALARAVSTSLRTSADLGTCLREIDGDGYGSYRRIEGEWAFGDTNSGFVLTVDHVQGDPNIALCDFLTRRFAMLVSSGDMNVPANAGRSSWGGPKGGDIQIENPGQHVIERTSVVVSCESANLDAPPYVPRPQQPGSGNYACETAGTGDGYVEARFTVALPASGRTVEGRRAWHVIGELLPSVVRNALFHDRIDRRLLLAHIASVEDQAALRKQLAGRGLVAFVRDGAVLPRASGDSDIPLDGAGAVAFESPASLRTTFTLPSGVVVSGMGIPRGITLIVGGGFHGKSTLLRALEVGCYDHVAGDGREFVCADPTATKIRAEDGRGVHSVDVSAFINNLPRGRDTRAFSSTCASGSTSQAANTVEAIEAGARLLLIDEDTTATNFMIRDRRMQLLVSREKEPITPFLHKVRSLYADHGVSTIIVVGGSGDYFDVADTVLQFDEYRPRDVTEAARRIAASMPSGLEEAFPGITRRIPVADSLQPPGDRSKVTAKDRHTISYGSTDIDLALVEQIVERAQTRAIGDALLYIRDRVADGRRTVADILALLDAAIDGSSLDILSRYPSGQYSRPRAIDVAAALNRLRTAHMRQAAAQ